MKEISVTIIYSLVLIVIYRLIGFEVAVLIAMANINIGLIASEKAK